MWLCCCFRLNWSCCAVLSQRPCTRNNFNRWQQYFSSTFLPRISTQYFTSTYISQHISQHFTFTCISQCFSSTYLTTFYPNTYFSIVHLNISLNISFVKCAVHITYDCSRKQVSRSLQVEGQNTVCLLSRGFDWPILWFLFPCCFIWCTSIEFSS